MSDAIKLDVLSSSPVQLDVGDADPIAREEIAALAGRVDAIEADYVTAEDVMGALGGEAPALVSGSSRAVLGDAETASWMQRTTAADGVALVEAVYGNTLRWNQLVVPRTGGATVNGITITATADGTITLNGTSEATANIVNWSVSNTQGHKYLIKSNTSDAAKAYIGSQSYGADTTGNGIIITNNSASPTWYYVLTIPAGGLTYDNVKVRPCIFDLTAMFGAGNEPATVAEFEALFPEPYYPYNPGSLLPVRIEGVETVGFNQIDLTKVHGVAHYNPSVGTVFESGTSDTATMTGENPCVVTVSSAWGGLSIISDELIPGETYRLEGNVSGSTPRVSIVVLDASYAVTRLLSNYSGGYAVSNSFTPTATERYLVVSVLSSAVGTVTLTNFCLHLSDPARNGTYEPHWTSQRAIPAATYFPQGLRSAGSVRDELRADAAVTRVGAVDLGTVDWTYAGGGDSRYFSSGENIPGAKIDPYAITYACSKYESVSPVVTASLGDKQLCRTVNPESKFFIKDSAYTDAAAFKAAMSGVMLHYALATPTTTPIDPPLPLSYRTGAGGTERVMVASGTQSAPPVFATRYPLDPADLAASIAPADGPIATTNHQVGDLIMLGFTLCKATQVIVTGETIEIGTNVTRTSVAAELAALSQ